MKGPVGFPGCLYFPCNALGRLLQACADLLEAQPLQEASSELSGFFFLIRKNLGMICKNLLRIMGCHWGTLVLN